MAVGFYAVVSAAPPVLRITEFVSLLQDNQWRVCLIATQHDQQVGCGDQRYVCVGVLNELLGVDVPITVAPCVKAALRRHPAYGGSVGRLAGAGATFLDPDAVTFRGADGLAAFEWGLICTQVGRG